MHHGGSMMMMLWRLIRIFWSAFVGIPCVAASVVGRRPLCVFAEIALHIILFHANFCS